MMRQYSISSIYSSDCRDMRLSRLPRTRGVAGPSRMRFVDRRTQACYRPERVEGGPDCEAPAPGETLQGQEERT